ncbi:MAG: DUF1554 domain-containing protein [Myxococcota bacterium]|jgi:hypothetical protein|nr:DUF1554 domain-containing protein [Myxococcota bacterium]
MKNERALGFLTSAAVACCCLFLSACGGEDGENNTNTTPTEDMGGENNSTNGSLVVFLSSMSYATDVGLDGLDEACNADEARPAGSGTFKALVGAPGRIPDAPGCDDTPTANNAWVLAPNTSYVTVDGEALFTTNDLGIFDDQGYPMGNATVGGATNFATALDKNWCHFEDDDCNGWSSDTGEMRVGWTASYGGAFLDGGGLQCGLALFVCVEQP